MNEGGVSLRKNVGRANQQAHFYHIAEEIVDGGAVIRESGCFPDIGFQKGREGGPHLSECLVQGQKIGLEVVFGEEDISVFGGGNGN